MMGWGRGAPWRGKGLSRSSEVVVLLLPQLFSYSLQDVPTSGVSGGFGLF